MRSACRTLGTIFLILGVIGAFALARSNGVELDYSSYSGIREERSMFLTVVWFAVGIFGTAVGTIILYALSEILENQEVAYSRISALEEKLELLKHESNHNTEQSYDKDSWRCTKCGRMNPNYTGTCACGNSK